jgi:PAS domain S-box-containing protein
MDARLAVPQDAELILANTPFLLTRCSADLRYLFVSEGYAHMLGCKPAEIAGRKIRDVMGAEGFNTILPHMVTVLSGRRVEYETRVHFKGVGPRLLHVVYNPDRDQGGQVVGWIASILDITEKRQSQKRIAADLRASEILRTVAAECLSDELTPTAALEKLLDAAIRIAGAAKGNLQLFDPGSGVLKIAAQSGFGSAFLDFFGAIAEEDAVACAAALKSRAPVIVADVSASEIFAGKPTLELLTDEGVRAVISLPLVSSKGAVLGVVSVHFTQVHQPPQQELHFLDLLARIAADYLQRRQAEETERLLLHEVQHRSSNLLAVVQALAASSGKDFDAFQKRLQALARSNRRINLSHQGRLSMHDSVAVQTEPFASRIVMRGPDITIGAQQAQNIGLVIHELVTNAAKYGALSNGRGTVHISWDDRTDGGLRLTWKEQGGPAVVKPARIGFGTKVIATSLPNAVIDYAPDGLYCRFDLRSAVARA